MVKMIVDSDALKLAVDDRGVVWYLNGEGMPHPSNLSDWDFLQSPVLQDAKQVRMVGSANNAELINHLYELKLKNELESLQVCSPMCCDIAEDRSDPSVLLFKMRNFNLAASLGGWHEFGRKDYPGYLLSAYYRRQKSASDYTRQATHSHVAWPAISFIENINIDAFSKLLAILLDPRWFVDMSESASNERLEQYLGLNPRTISAEADSDPKVSRCQLVLDCWKTTPASGVTPATSIPRNFLWRVWAERGGGVRGDLAASRLFVSFLQATWTKSMCTLSQASRLFVPRYFFPTKEEADAYAEYEKTFKSSGTLGDNS
jgi:hypothetical protein